MRTSRFKGGKSYSLFGLVGTFQDSFCTEPRDKIYAFVGMANDISPSSIPTSYEKSLFEVYQDVIVTQNTSLWQSQSKKIDMLHFSALVRALLARKAGRTKKSWWKNEFALDGEPARGQSEGFCDFYFTHDPSLRTQREQREGVD